MAENRVLPTLRLKRRELEDAIVSYEKTLHQARADLVHLIGVIMLFESVETPGEMPAYADLHRVFKRTETMDLCKEAMRKHGPQTTVQLAAYIMVARGLDPQDHVMRRAVADRIIHALRMQEKRGKIADAGRAKGGVRIWASPV